MYAIEFRRKSIGHRISAEQGEKGGKGGPPSYQNLREAIVDDGEKTQRLVGTRKGKDTTG